MPIKNFIKRVLGRSGYEIKGVTPRQRPAVILHKYLKKDGSFDYERYRKVQINGNKAHLHSGWAIEENVAFLANYLKREVPDVRFGICHGTRQGKEQEWFRKFLNCEVIGTEISDTASQFPHTIQWDFHEVKPEWLGAVDFIYSNSFDHSYDPEKCLNAWMKCLRKDGVCIIEHSTMHDTLGATELDPFGANICIMPYLILQWGKGTFSVREILDAPRTDSVRKYAGDAEIYLKFLVIRNNH